MEEKARGMEYPAKEALQNLYQKYFVQQGVTLEYVMRVLLIFVTATVAWWVFNLIVRRLEKGIESTFLFRKIGSFSLS